MTDQIDPQVDSPEPFEESEAPTGAGAIFGPFFNAIVGPADCFRALDARPVLAVWIAVWVMVFSTAMSIYNLPITRQVMVQSTAASLRAQGSEMSAEQLEGLQQQMVFVANIFGYASSIFLLVLMALTALVIWVMAAVMGGRGATFGRAFGVAAAAAVIRPLLYSVYVAIILNMNPPEIRRPEDAATMTPTLGIDLLLSGPDTPVWLDIIFQRIDLFMLWWMALVVMGSVAVLKLSRGHGIAIASIMWLIGTVFAVGGALLQTLGS